SVMIGVNPPGNFLWDAKTTDQQIGRYAALCSKDDRCRERTDDLAASMRKTAAEIPDRWWLLPIKEGNVPVASFYGLAESTMENAPLSSPMTLSSWLSADEGDASGFWLQSLLADLFFPGSFVWGEYAAVATSDAEAARDYFSSGGRDRYLNLGEAATAFGWGGGRLTDAWPAAPDADEYSRVRTSEVETLLIGGALDVATPPQIARKELLPSLPNGRQVVLPAFGHTLDFWTYQPEAGSRLITTYFATGEVDDSLYESQAVDFTPEVTQTALGKGIGGAMAGLAVLTVLSLLWMTVRRRARFGRKTSAVLRSVYPVVLGLGGWFLGVLLVITTMPGTPLDDERLATLSVGLPIGLGIYLAWRNRDWSARTKTAGFVAAVGTSLVGAWLGFHAAVDLVALVTAIVGSTAGANLTLILLDISRAPSARERPATETAVDPRRRAAPAGAGMS
ncbi:MAG: alpha/beta hydrolase, partial [Gaiellaceae bacterium]